MATNVLFSKGSSVNFQNISKDPNTLYFLNDTHEIYLGGDKYAFGTDISVVITGSGDTVSNVSFDAGQKKLIFALSDAAQAASSVSAIQSAIATCVKSIVSSSAAIVIDSNDSENPAIGLKLATGANAGNVKLEETLAGLKASVDIPEAALEGVDANDKILKVIDGTICSQLSITTVKESGKTYVVLIGKNNTEVSRFDASEFVKDGMLDSVSLRYSSDGLNHRLLVMTFNTDAGKEEIALDINELIDVYTAAAGGGLEVNGSNEFSIKNTVTPSDGIINSNKAPAFGETITLKAVRYDSHGLITGVGDFTFKMPSLVGGSVGGTKKLVTLVTVGTDGTTTGQTVDIATELSAASLDSQIPTAKAVYTAIEGAKTVWESL